MAFTSGNFRLAKNLPGFSSPEYSRLEEAGRLESDPKKRIQIYRDPVAGEGTTPGIEYDASRTIEGRVIGKIRGGR